MDCGKWSNCQSYGRKNNLIENCLIENTNSNQVLLVNDQMKVLNCVPKDKIKIEQQD